MGPRAFTERRARLYCRASSPATTPVARYRAELRRLQSTGVLDDVEVTTWPERIELETHHEGRTVRTYERFVTWAEGAGVGLAPAFTVRAYDSEFTGESGTELLTPVASLAVYRDEELTAVYPHADGTTIHTVEDGLDSLRTGVVDPAPAVAEE